MNPDTCEFAWKVYEIWIFKVYGVTSKKGGLARSLNINIFQKNFVHGVFVGNGTLLEGKTWNFRKKCFFEQPYCTVGWGEPKILPSFVDISCGTAKND